VLSSFFYFASTDPDPSAIPSRDALSVIRCASLADFAILLSDAWAVLQLADKVKLFTRLRSDVEEFKANKLDTSAMVAIPLV
jgi:hypothetical protein